MIPLCSFVKPFVFLRGQTLLNQPFKEAGLNEKK
jgi:hypothetical protein